jgi:hypothetical protein
MYSVFTDARGRITSSQSAQSNGSHPKKYVSAGGPTTTVESVVAEAVEYAFVNTPEVLYSIFAFVQPEIVMVTDEVSIATAEMPANTGK